MTSNSENSQAKAAQDKLKEIQGDAKGTTQAAQDKAQDLKGKAQETAQAAGEKTQEVAQTAKDKVQETAEAAKSKVQETAQTVKEKAPSAAKGTEPTESSLPTVIPNLNVKAESSAQDLKSRLDWGEPALTIIDVRNRDMHNQGHITGATPIPMDKLVEQAQSSLDPKRDIYVYGESDQETAQAASKLREAGFVNVAELKGGLGAWKAIAGATDGLEESGYEPGPQATNVVSRVTDAVDKQSNR